MQYEFRKRLQEYDLFACMGHVMIFVHWYMGYMVTNLSLAELINITVFAKHWLTRPLVPDIREEKPHCYQFCYRNSGWQPDKVFFIELDVIIITIVHVLMINESRYLELLELYGSIHSNRSKIRWPWNDINDIYNITLNINEHPTTLNCRRQPAFQSIKIQQSRGSREIEMRCCLYGVEWIVVSDVSIYLNEGVGVKFETFKRRCLKLLSQQYTSIQALCYNNCLSTQNFMKSV